MSIAGQVSVNIENVKAGLPQGIDLQTTTVLLASAVCQAYAAFNNGPDVAPTFDGALAGYSLVASIYVPELDPDGNPFGSVETTILRANSLHAGKQTILPKLDPASVSPIAQAGQTCVGPNPGTPSSGRQFFGFTATNGTYNILALRGTATLEEAGYDLLGWGSNTQCLLPVVPTSTNPQEPYGNVNGYLWSFYTTSFWNGDSWDPPEDFPTLSASCLSAIQAATTKNPKLPWLVAAHSLGGAMLSLAALEAQVTGAFGGNKVIAMTFGSLHVGDQAFAQAYTKQLPISVRYANLCDFVPSMVSLEPGSPPQNGYVHVGAEATFAWQTWDDWGNHSLAGMYLPVVQNYWNSIYWGSQTYPLVYGASS